MKEGLTKIYCSDIETTGLTHHLIEQCDDAKLHNICSYDIESKETYLIEGSNNIVVQNFLDQEIVLIMHNGICYDKNALKILGYNVDKIHFVDTLALSWYLDLNRDKHGLESYGEEFNVPKPEVKDWKDLTQEDYNHRVREDVKIQYRTYKKLKGMFEELYGELTDYQFCTHRVVKYLNYKMEQLSEQQETRILVDVPKAKSLISMFESLIEEKTTQLASVMPKVPVYTKSTRPAKPFKKDGSLSATGEKWKELTKKANVDFDFDGEIKSVKGYNEPNPSSSAQVKDWLFTLGWQPETYKFVKSEDGERKIPQVYIQGSGGMICPSIERLAEETPDVQALVGLGVVKHRKGCVQGFLDSLIFGEFVEAGANGFTNTLRLKHRKPCVNMPSSRSAYGEEVRSCLIAREGRTFVCSDLSSMENIWKFNYQKPYDKDYVESQQSDDYDPHLDIAVEGGLCSKSEADFYKIKKSGFPVENYEKTEELMKLLSLSDDDMEVEVKRIGKIRGKGKNTNYGCQYGAGGATIARTAGVDLATGKRLVKAYKKLNWSIDAISKDQVVKKVSHGSYQWNPYSKMWYHLKTDKDRFSTLVQGSGSFLLDIWLKFIDNIKKERDLKDNIKLCMSMHDENLQEFQGVTEEEVVGIFQMALDNVNKFIKVDIPFGCDTQIGYKYSEIH